MIGVLLAFAVLLCQMYYGLIPHEMTVRAIASVGWPYLALAVTLVAAALLSAPIKLDAERAAAIAGLELSKDGLSGQLSAERERVRALQAERDAPKVSGIETARISSARDTLGQFTDAETSLLRYLLQCGRIVPSALKNSGLDDAVVSAAIEKGQRVGFVEHIGPDPRTFAQFWQIKDEFRAALEVVLYMKGAL